ncbi:MAG: carboxypeptidase-like regulatory domain-containing protein, partial [Bacteroidales bacterium]|nr:carboxypeptidase-like regulatory domain-containing protein [Bacteroidales bacterium]
MKKFTIISMLITMISLLSAQNSYIVTGTMVDSLNKEKVMFSTVLLMTPDSTARMVGKSLTDAQGTFRITDIPAGDYLLVATLVGYERASVPVTVGGDKRTIDLGDIPMRKTSTDLEEVKIIGEKPLYMVDGEKTLY